MLPGRKPTPVHLQVVTGVSTRSKFVDSRRDDRPKSKRRLRIPTDLTRQQKLLWQNFAKHAVPGQLEPADAELMRLLVVHASLAREYELKLRSTGPLIKTPNGMPVQSPYLSMVNKQTSLVHKLLTSLAFTPTERARLGVGKFDMLAEDELDDD